MKKNLMLELQEQKTRSRAASEVSTEDWNRFDSRAMLKLSLGMINYGERRKNHQNQKS
jgi:hypothetical protein